FPTVTALPELARSVGGRRGRTCREGELPRDVSGEQADGEEVGNGGETSMTIEPVEVDLGQPRPRLIHADVGVLRETEVRNVNGYHELLVNRRHPVVSHVSAPFCWKGDALNRNRIVDVLGGCESPGGFDVIIVAT